MYDDVKLVDHQILVGYGYDLDESPEWYKVAWKNSIFGQVKSFKKNIVVIKVTIMVGIMKIDMKKSCNKCDNGRNDGNESSLRRGSSTRTGWSAQLGNRSLPLSVIGANENHSYNKLYLV